MDLGILGRKALVLGSSQGLGYAIARTLVSEGAGVTLTGRSSDKLAAAAAALAAGGAAVATEVVDLSDAASVSALVERIADRAIDILVLNSGGPPPGPVSSVDTELWTSQFATPKIALAPLMIIWFGIGILPKVILAATFVFFVVFLSTLAGVATVPPQLVSVVRVMGAAPLAVFRKVVVPSALPFILTALRLTIPAALIGAVIGEFISSNRGVGYLINAASSRYATAEVFAGIGSLLVVVLCMNAGLSLLERSWSRWAPRDGLGSQ